MVSIICFVLAVTLLIFEMFTGGFFLACLSIAALFAAVTALLVESVLLVVIVAVVAAILSLVFIRPIAKSKLLSSKSTITNVDAYIGREAVVVSKVTNNSGRVKVGGEEWPARSFDKQEYEIGEKLRLIERRNNTFIVG